MSARAGLAALLALVALGCSFGQTVPEKRRFVLSAAREGERGPACETTLLVHRFRVSPLFERKGFTYRTGDDTYTSHFYDEFYAPPGMLLRGETLAWLREADVFRAVLEPGAPARPEWVLEARVERMYADVRDKPTVVLEIDFALLEGLDLTEAWRKRFGARLESASDAAPDLVDAWGRALAQLLALLERDLRAFVAARGRCGAPQEATAASP